MNFVFRMAIYPKGAECRMHHKVCKPIVASFTNSVEENDVCISS